jgi:DNA primase catalytic core
VNHEVDAVKRLISIGSLLNTDKKRIKCPLPSHPDKHPSCDVDHDLGLWHCKGCDAGGDVFNLLMLRDRMSFAEALKELAAKAGVELGKKKSAEAAQHWEQEQRASKALAAAAAYYHNRLIESVGGQAWLESRGITLETAQRLQLGLADGALIDYLKNTALPGLSQDDFINAGLLHTYKPDMPYRDYFRNRIIFPLAVRGRVLNISGRAMLADDKPKYLHLEKRPTEYFYNEDAIGDKVWLFEGHPDTVTGFQAGLPAVGVIGTSGMTRPERLKHCREIYICGDADAAGQQAVDRWAIEILKHNSNVSIKFVSLPGGAKDFNEWYVQHKGNVATQFSELEGSARDLMAFRISKLRSTEDLQSIWPLLDSKPLATHDAFFNAIKRQLGNAVGIKTLRQDFKTYSDSRKAQQITEAQVISASFDGEELMPINAYIQVKPAAKAHVCLYAKVKRQNGDDIVDTWEPRVIQASIDPETGKYSAEAFSPAEQEGFNASSVPLRSVVTKRWGDKSIQKFLTGSAEPVNTADLMRDLSAYFSRYIYHENPVTFDVLACYAMGSYIARAFMAFPYLALNGLAGSGKTNLLTLLYEVCFNAFMVTNNSVATLYRVIEMCFPTYIRDEAEQFNKTTPENQDEKTILNSGYKASGGTVPRMDKDKNGGMKVVEFNVYSPKIFAGINMLDNTLLTRSILISMFKAPRREVEKLTSMSHNQAAYLSDAAALRDRLYQWGLTKFHLVHHLFENFPPQEKLANRDWEIWSPLLAIALLADNEGLRADEEPFVQRILRFSEEKVSERKELAQDNVIEQKVVATLLELVKYGLAPHIDHKEFYPVKDAAKAVSDRLVEEGYLKDEIKSRWLMKILAQTKVISNRDEQVKKLYPIGEGRQHQHVALSVARLEEVLGTL